MAGGHSHGGAASAGSEHRGALLAATVLIGIVFGVELVAGLLTNSLALLSDAAHMFTDVLGLSMALAAIHVASVVSAGGPRTFGWYRLEILAALANAVLLFGVAIWILVEALQRFSDPPAVLGAPMLAVAVLGLVVNLVAFALLRRGSAESLNLEGAYLEVLADTLGSVGVVVAAVVLQTTGFALIDPIFGVGIGLFVLPRTYRLGRQALRILLQVAPPGMDVDAMARELAGMPGVGDVHDLHAWTLTSGMDVATAHLRLAAGGDPHEVLGRARTLLREGYGISHATLQVEPPEDDDCAHDW